jgi:transposase
MRADNPVLVQAGHLARALLCAHGLDGKLFRRRRRRQYLRQGASLCGRGKRGAFAHAIGRSRGGRTTKIHALTDDHGRPRTLVITAGNTHDLVGAAEVLRRSPPLGRLLADRAYDARKLRDWLTARGIEPVIPPNPTRKHPHSWNAEAYRSRNLIERMFCRLKDFRRVATRYDKRADNFLSTVMIAATLTWWTPIESGA